MPNSYSKNLYTQWKAGKSGSVPKSSQGGVFFNDGSIKHLPIGFIARPKRTKPVGGSLLDRAQKYNQHSYRLRQRGPDGRFIDTSRSRLDTRGRKMTGKDVRVQNKGVPMVLLASETKTHHHQIVDRDAAMNRGHERSIAMFQQRFDRALGNA